MFSIFQRKDIRSTSERFLTVDCRCQVKSSGSDWRSGQHNSSFISLLNKTLHVTVWSHTSLQNRILPVTMRMWLVFIFKIVAKLHLTPLKPYFIVIWIWRENESISVLSSRIYGERASSQPKFYVSREIHILPQRQKGEINLWQSSQLQIHVKTTKKCHKMSSTQVATITIVKTMKIT